MQLTLVDLYLPPGHPAMFRNSAMEGAVAVSQLMQLILVALCT